MAVSQPRASRGRWGRGSDFGGYDNLPGYRDYSRPAPSIRAVRRIDLTARNIADVTINVRRTNVGCSVDLHVDTDGPMTIKLAGCQRTISAGGGS